VLAAQKPGDDNFAHQKRRGASLLLAYFGGAVF